MKPPGTISASDIHNLLAAISKYESRERAQIPSDYSTRTRGAPELVLSRVTKVLDSLAGLLVSKNHEVIAIAIRVDPTSKAVEFIIGSNGDIIPNTTAHLESIWKTLKRISSQVHELHSYDPDNDTPTDKITNGEFQSQLFQLSYQCVKHSSSRLQKQVNGKFPLFQMINVKGFDRGHPFVKLRARILALEACFTREDTAEIGKPTDANIEQWKLLLGLLRECQQGVKEFLNAGGFSTASNLFRVTHFPKWETYLRKIAAIINDIDTLSRAAYSPQCRHLFTYNLKLTKLCGFSSKAQKIPQTAKDWQLVLEKALAQCNRLESLRPEYELKVMNMAIINNDTTLMSREAVEGNLFVHCEAKILAHIAKSESEYPLLPKAYPYVGLSKLSCRGCEAFFKAYNHVHHTNSMTRGSHGKSYFPWQFPQMFPKSDDTVRTMYDILVQRWVNAYDGYETEKVPLQADFTAGLADTQMQVWEYDAKTVDNLADRFQDL